MKKAVIVGGSNGIGLAITKQLIEKGYYTYILDRTPLDGNVSIDSTQYTYLQCDLLDFNESLFSQLSADRDIEVLMITAGFGRVADFEYLHIAEIENLMRVNAISAIKILRLFFDRIKSNDDFYCGILGSIAGLVSSPMFSVYAASKASVCRFVESVNIELEGSGVSNRILNISPGSIKGTKFNGGENDLSQLNELSQQILQNLFNREVLFIPGYEQTYKSVIKNYYADPHCFGLNSYQYKKNSGRVCNEHRVCVGYLSGTFDLFHVGHLNLLKKAKQQCDYLIVGVHPDASHKGKETFIPHEERMKIISSIKYVDKVVTSVPEDSDAWNLLHYSKLFVGSDYKGTERFLKYEEFFKDKGVEIVYFPYTKGTSSTQIRSAVIAKSKDLQK